ncbi:MAG: dephospho-CoA kinase, partial [Mycobacterium sp.]
ALLFVDWLIANPAVQQDFAAADETWFRDAYQQAWAWAEATDWAPKA